MMDIFNMHIIAVLICLALICEVSSYRPDVGNTNINQKRSGCNSYHDPCRNGGVCTNRTDGTGGFCTCAAGYIGPMCEYVLSEGAVRLVSNKTGTVIEEGKVEVYHNGIWGTVCDHDLDEHVADVVCQQLGLLHGVVSSGPFYGEGTAEKWLDGVKCTGEEGRINECHLGWGNDMCRHFCKSNTG
ncbi:galectin-3-binding protein B-like [Amphiura filiformis]|uniref:galectin-3-binding protein B-like n=1 Tax=Amphiura filiformis TaxID=82378 RepID=UPI003B212FD4